MSIQAAYVLNLTTRLILGKLDRVVGFAVSEESRRLIAGMPRAEARETGLRCWVKQPIHYGRGHFPAAIQQYRFDPLFLSCPEET
jgi:hypothetical protein